MESQELIDAFREQIAQVEAQGSSLVQVSALKIYLSALEKDAAASMEYRKQKHEGILAHYAANNQHSIEMVKAILETGKSALHSLLLINGGAVVALLGVMANLARNPDGAVLARYLALPLIQFGVGVLCGALGFAFRYFSQACYCESAGEKDNSQRWGDRFRNMAIIVAAVGYVLFGFAIFNSYYAVIWSFSP